MNIENIIVYIQNLISLPNNLFNWTLLSPFYSLMQQIRDGMESIQETPEPKSGVMLVAAVKLH